MATVAVVGSAAWAVATYQADADRNVLLWSIDDQGIVAGYVVEAGDIVPADSVAGFAGYSERPAQQAARE